ncbi:MAG: hypothetical protein ABIH41_02990 [Nanoarchaeota archaeon]
MAHINIQIPDDLHKKLKLEAVKAGRTLKEHIITILEHGQN